MYLANQILIQLYPTNAIIRKNNTFLLVHLHSFQEKHRRRRINSILTMIEPLSLTMSSSHVRILSLNCMMTMEAIKVQMTLLAMLKPQWETLWVLRVKHLFYSSKMIKIKLFQLGNWQFVAKRFKTHRVHQSLTQISSALK